MGHLCEIGLVERYTKRLSTGSRVGPVAGDRVQPMGALGEWSMVCNTLKNINIHQNTGRVYIDWRCGWVDHEVP